MDVLIDGVKKALMNNNPDVAAAYLKEYLEKEKNIPLNIAVTGESGSGKSSFVNAFRGIKNNEKGAAPTGVVETTLQDTAYPHPSYPNVTLWDLPGIGTTKFPADKYLERIGFEKFDFFIIVSDTRFREHDVKLAQEIQRLKKNFYFVRSKIDHNLRDEKEDQRDFNAENTLARIRKDCTDGLMQSQIKYPQVFLVSSCDLQLFDFSRLHKTLEKELPQHKRNALLFAMPNINKEIINKKKNALQSYLKYYAALSAAGAAVPIPGLSAFFDLNLMVNVVTDYVHAFGLDIQSLKRLSTRTSVPFKDLISDFISSLAAVDITPGLLLKVILQLSNFLGLMGAGEATRFIPIIGIPLAMSLSFTTTYNILKYFLNTLADDAEKVFNRILALKA